MMRQALLTFFILATHFTWSQDPDFSLVGFATLNGGTTGGEGGMEVTASTYEELKNYAESADIPYIIKIENTITGTGSVVGKDYKGSIKVASNKSIIGVDDLAFLDGVGLTMDGGSNIVVQNIRMSFISIAEAIPPGSPDISGIYSALGDEGRPQILVNGGDLISIRGTSKNIWIDHCELYSEDPAIQTNIDLYDGLIDIKNQTGFITISWSYFHDHHKVHLVGSSETDLFADRKITFHHNHYENLGSRLPFYRGAVGHVFNNYYMDGLSSCVNSLLGACVKVEKNYFEDSKNPVQTSNGDGFAERIDNKEVNCTFTKPYPEMCTANLGYVYDDVLTTNVDDVKNLVLEYAGVNKKIITSIEEAMEFEDLRVTVFPNPSKGMISIRTSFLKEYEVEIADLSGKIVLQVNSIGMEENDLLIFGKGVYFLIVKSGNNRAVRKFMIK